MNKIITTINPRPIASSRRPSAQSSSLPKSSRDSAKGLRVPALKGGEVMQIWNSGNSGGLLPNGDSPPNSSATTEGSKQPPATSTHRESQLVLFELGVAQW